jgi:energy-coupling factor transporter ATP-binding protein EcfA2
LNHEGKTVVVNKMLAHYLLCHKEVAETSGQDVVGLVVGGEGAGKSKLVRQMGKLIDPKLTEQRIEFDPESFIQQHYKGLPETWEHEIYVKGGYEGKPYECIIMDESIEANRRRAMSEMNVKLISFLTQSRQLHKIVFIVLPSPFLLEKYIGEFRAKFIINVKFDRKKNERVFQYYNQKGLRKIFNATANFRNSAIFDIVRPIHTGNFPKTEPFDIRRYEAKKAGAINKYRTGTEEDTGMSKAEVTALVEYAALERAIKQELDFPTVYKALGMPPSTAKDLRKLIHKRLGIATKLRGAAKRADETVKEFKTVFKELKQTTEDEQSNT